MDHTKGGRLEPVSVNLNMAALLFSRVCWPAGYDVTDTPADAPSTLQGLTHYITGHGKPLIWSGASNQTIFGDPEINIAFRAWHDWVHWRYQLPFTLEGECMAGFVQAAQVTRRYGADSEMVALILCEVIAQAVAYEKTGQFPDDQRLFSAEYAGDPTDPGIIGLAESLDVTDQRALEIGADFYATSTAIAMLGGFSAPGKLGHVARGHLGQDMRRRHVAAGAKAVEEANNAAAMRGGRMPSACLPPTLGLKPARHARRAVAALG